MWLASWYLLCIPTDASRLLFGKSRCLFCVDNSILESADTYNFQHVSIYSYYEEIYPIKPMYIHLSIQPTVKA